MLMLLFAKCVGCAPLPRPLDTFPEGFFDFYNNIEEDIPTIDRYPAVDESKIEPGMHYPFNLSCEAEVGAKQTVWAEWIFTVEEQAERDTASLPRLFVEFDVPLDYISRYAFQFSSSSSIFKT